MDWNFLIKNKESLHVTTDSRNVTSGSIFVALKGEHFDGNDFVEQARKDGAEYIISGENALKDLQDLARAWRRELGLPILGITGTNGKTTTKELCAAVLSTKYKLYYTQGNLNNQIGVPLTLLSITRAHEMAIVEMGASHPGDIQELVEIAEPNYGLITNVGKAHLQGFGSFEGVVRTKGELFDYLRTKEQSTVFIHHDNPHLMGIAQGLRLVCYGTEPDESLAVEGKVDACAPFLQFSYRQPAGAWHHIESRLIGSYNLYNMLAAACIGLHFGVTPEQIDHALTHYIPSNNRSQLEETGRNHLIVDAYNANPTSMAAALDNFRRMEVKNKMAILGDMRELGDVSAEEHQKTVDYLQHDAFCEVWLVGEEFGKTQCPFRKFKTVEEVEAELARHCPEDHYILIKGSNGIHLAQLKDKL